MHGMLQRWKNRSLTRNPVEWLERREWGGRLVIWSWLAIMVSIYGWLLANTNLFYRSLERIHGFMGSLLILSLAMSAAGSFRRERETRLLELLLVSPMNEWQLILGRLRGLCGQFLPSIGLLLAGWTYLALATAQGRDSGAHMFEVAVTLPALPVVGFYFSLTCRVMIPALLWTFLLGNLLHLVDVLPALPYWHGVAEMSAPVLNTLLHPSLLQVPLAGTLLQRLHRRLVHRTFALEGAG